MSRPWSHPGESKYVQRHQHSWLRSMIGEKYVPKTPYLKVVGIKTKTMKRDWFLYLRAAKRKRASSETVVLVLLERLELNIPSILFLLEVSQSQLELGI